MAVKRIRESAPKVRTTDISVLDVAVPTVRLRMLRPDSVRALAESMQSNGLLQPILVRQIEANGCALIAGRHRLEAAKSLGWDQIRATILDDISAHQAELCEVDENLIRADLTMAERAIHVGRRKELYIALHPATKTGGAPGAGKGRGKKSANVASFQTETAVATGRSKRSVEVDAARAAKIPNLHEVVGTSLDEGKELDALAELPAGKQAEVIARAKKGDRVSAKTYAKQIRRADREVALAAKQTALPTGKFGVIVEDYEWDQQVWSRETGMDRHAANHYPVSEDAHTPEEIVERTKDRMAVAAADCVLFMWATVPHLAIAIHVLELRGFKYVSNFVWPKDRAGTGYWNRNRHEHVLIGVRGNIPAPAPGTQWESVLQGPVRQHSRKPDAVYELIEAYFPNLPRIELNARYSREGWTSWGNETEVADS